MTSVFPIARGRKPGRPLTDLELRYLRLLRQVGARAHRDQAEYDALYEDFVLECLESGASVRVIADQLGVSSSTVQAWATNARDRRVK